MELSKNSRMLGMLCHLITLVGFVIPFGNIIGPLVLWLVKKDEDPFVDDQGREALNFQITVTIAYLICLALIIIAIGAILLPIVGLANLILVIVAAIKANDGVNYRYPFAIRLL